MKNRMNFPAALAALAAITLLAIPARADVTVDKMFSDHMVLQRGMNVPVWGTAEAGEKVTVAFKGQTLETVADAAGKWMVKLAPLKTGDPGEQLSAGRDRAFRRRVHAASSRAAGGHRTGAVPRQAR